MDNRKIARMLIKIAKEIQCGTKELVLISDLDKGIAYFAESEGDTISKTDKSLYNEAIKFNDTATMGKTIATPEKYFSSKDKMNYRKYGVGKEFKI